MKKILFLITFLSFTFGAYSQTTIIDYYELWSAKQQQIRLEVAIHSVATTILATPADSIFSVKAAGIVLRSNVADQLRLFTREAINRAIDPSSLTDAQLKTGIRVLFISEYWAEQLRSGAITAIEYYAATQ